MKLADVNSNYDFVSVRAGIQPFVSDFRGFIFSDNNLGLRLFGSADNNRIQYNAAYFSMLEKDTNSGLNRFDTRHQNVYIANIFRQDFIRKGYTIEGSLHFNDDRRSIEYDRNGFLVRPALIGDVRPHAIKVAYLGFNGDGHIGRLNLTHSYYYAFGHDDRNPIAGRSVDVQFQHGGAVEASVDQDFLRFKGSFFWAQGDSNPTDDKASGFDAIFDDPNFVGGQFSYWNRNGIRLTQTGVGLVSPTASCRVCAAAKRRDRQTLSIQVSLFTTPESTSNSRSASRRFSMLTTYAFIAPNRWSTCCFKIIFVMI